MERNNQIERLKLMLEEKLSNEEIVSRMDRDIKELQNDLPCGINAIIINDKEELLLLKRKFAVGKGTWSLCGGHLQLTETFEECIVRECNEELGIMVKLEDVEVVSLGDTNRTGGGRYLQIGLLIKHYEGIPEIKEPNKASELKWFSKDNLPDNLFYGTRPQISLYFKNKFYDKDSNVYLNRN